MRKTGQLPSRDLLNTLLHYDKATGKLYWRERKEGKFVTPGYAERFNSRLAGKEAGFTKSRKSGYKQKLLALDGKFYIAARLILIMNGVKHDELDGMEVDHINRDPTDNRLENLRVVSTSENSRNRGLQSNNTSGYCGVRLHKKSGLWFAYVKLNGKNISCKYHKDKEDAAKAAAVMRKKLGFADSHGEPTKRNNEK